MTPTQDSRTFILRAEATVGMLPGNIALSRICLAGSKGAEKRCGRGAPGAKPEYTPRMVTTTETSRVKTMMAAEPLPIHTMMITTGYLGQAV